MTSRAPAFTIGSANRTDVKEPYMTILVILKENASAIAAIFSVLGVIIGYGNYRLNMAQTAFQIGTTPVFEPEFDNLSDHPGWWQVCIVIRNRAPTTLVVQSVSIPRWRRCRLAPMPEDGSTPNLSATEGGKRIDFATEVLPKDKSMEIQGRTWRSDTSGIEFFLYSPRSPCPMRISWRSKASSRRYRNSIVS